MNNFRNANPDASRFVLVTKDDVPMGMCKNDTPGDVMLAALGHAEVSGPIRVFNDGFHVCTVEVPTVDFAQCDLSNC